jgi:predicted phosphodiesterase
MIFTITSDLHTYNPKHKLIAEKIPQTDGIITLGDIPFESLKLFADTAKNFGKKIYGVYGNHVQEGMFEEVGIIRLDNYIAELGDKFTKTFSITGFSGSSKYQNHDFMIEQN